MFQSKFKTATIKFALAFSLVLVLSVQAWASHPYHVSKSEVEWNSKTGNFEVAMCVWPADLEKALSAKAGKPVDLDKVEDLDGLLKAYVESKFIMQKSVAVGKKEGAASLRWVGHEKNNKEAWLYFEVNGDKSPSDWTLKNKIFCELNEDQLNQIQFTINGDLSSFISTVATKPHAVRTIKSSIKRKPKGLVITKPKS